MGARIINFPLNRIVPAKKLPYTAAPSQTGATRETAGADWRPHKETRTLHDIMHDEELAREMFSPDYFMLVE